MSDLLMLDTITPSALYGLKFDGVAGYVGGSWPDFSVLHQMFPALAKANRIISIAVSATEEAEFLDCESGDATIGQVPGWVSAALARGVWRPGVYANSSTWDSGLRTDLEKYGGRVRRWVADWVYHPGLIPGYDAQQWAPSYEGRNVDPSTVLDDFFAPTPQPKHVNPLHYERFIAGSFQSIHFGKLDERTVVEAYDAARKKKQGVEKLEAELKWLADRVAWEAIYGQPLKSGDPSWGSDWRGWRYQHLVHRAQGHLFSA
jgi:hypothetical protein